MGRETYEASLLPKGRTERSTVLYGFDRFRLVGHDIGGAIAQLLATAQTQRVRWLMLIDTVSYDTWPSETWQAIVRGHLHDYAAMPHVTAS